MLRNFSALLLSLALLLTATSATTPEFVGDTESAINQCTSAPDFAFTAACDEHDRCYYHHAAPRKVCDQWFLADMQAICQQEPTPLQVVCHGIAWLYYKGVEQFGASGYQTAGLKFH